MSPDQKRFGNQPQPNQFDINNPALREHRKQISSITGESARLSKIPQELEVREPIIEQLFSGEESIDVLLSPEARRSALEYCAIGAQVDQSITRIEEQFDASNRLAQKKYRGGQYPKPVRQYLEGIAEYVSNLDIISPLASLDPDLRELAQTEFPHGAFYINMGRDRDIANTYARIGTNFSNVEGAEQHAIVAFLTELGIRKYETAETKEKRSAFTDINVFSEVQDQLNGAGRTMNQYFSNYSKTLFQRMYGDEMTELQEIAYPPYDETSLLPRAIGTYIAESRAISNDFRCILPVNLKAMLDAGLIPHLTSEDASKIAKKQAENFYEFTGDIQTLTDKAGHHPYELIEQSYRRGTAFDFFSTLATRYATEQTPDPSGKLFDNLHRIAPGIENRFITLNGENEIAAIDISAKMSHMNIILIGHQKDSATPPDAIAIEVDYSGQVYGLPSAYAAPAKEFLGYIINKALDGLEANGIKMLSSEESMQEVDIEWAVENRLQERIPYFLMMSRGKTRDELNQMIRKERQRIYNEEKERRVIEGTEVSEMTLLEQEAKRPTELRIPESPTEPVHPTDRGSKRYTIDVPQEQLAGLSSELQRRFLAAVERVEYSPFGSNVMKKLKGIEDRWRIAFSGNRAILERDEQGTFHVTDILKRDSQTYNVARRRLS